MVGTGCTDNSEIWINSSVYFIECTVDYMDGVTDNREIRINRGIYFTELRTKSNLSFIY